MSVLWSASHQAQGMLTALALPEMPPEGEWGEGEESGTGHGPEIEVQMFVIGAFLILAGIFSESYMVAIFLAAAGVLMLWTAIKITFG